jgi:hypothetical protein
MEYVIAVNHKQYRDYIRRTKKCSCRTKYLASKEQLTGGTLYVLPGAEYRSDYNEVMTLVKERNVTVKYV